MKLHFDPEKMAAAILDDVEGVDSGLQVSGEWWTEFYLHYGEAEAWPIYRAMLERSDAAERWVSWIHVFPFLRDVPADLGEVLAVEATKSRAVAEMLVLYAEDDLATYTPWLALCFSDVLASRLGVENDRRRRSAVEVALAAPCDEVSSELVTASKQGALIDPRVAWCHFLRSRPNDVRQDEVVAARLRPALDWAAGAGSDPAIAELVRTSVGEELDRIRLLEESHAWELLTELSNQHSSVHERPLRAFNVLGFRLASRIRDEIAQGAAFGNWAQELALRMLEEPWHGEPTPSITNAIRRILTPASD